jgi:hypothetical protein
MESVLGALPPSLWDVDWDSSAIPGVADSDPRRLRAANCQAFAYAVLSVHGFHMAPLRSDELWHDEECTTHAHSPQPLDLLLVNSDRDPYGAHVGVVVDADRVLHLNKEVGRPVVWGWADFSGRSRYSVVIGYKRPHRRG